MRTAFLCLLLCALALPARAQSLYWSETNFPGPLGRTAASNGAAATEVALQAASLPEGVAFDELHRRIYWVESRYVGARILSASPDWSGVQVVVSGGSSFRGIAVDAAGGKLYWTSSNLVEGAKIRRANLDGSGVQVLADLGTAGANPRGIALDPAGGKMYWADLGLGQVQRANLDGSAPETIATNASPFGVAVDPAAGRVYWSNLFQGNVTYCALAGGTPVKWKVGLRNPTAIALDVPGAMLYWQEAGATGQKLRRATTTVNNPPITILPVTLATYGGLAFSPNAIVDAQERGRVTEFALGRPTPSPSAGPTRFEFALPRAAHVRLRAFDVRGREVATLADGDYPAGRHAATWDRANAAAGVYFLRFEAPGVALTQRCVLLP
jgi:hypothetical protein